MILGRDFSIQNCIGISWTKANTRQLTQNNEVIAATEEYQPASRATVSLKRSIKIPPQSCTVVDMNINSTKEVKVEIIPDELWLSANPNICTYPMLADLKDKQGRHTALCRALFGYLKVYYISGRNHFRLFCFGP